MNILRNNRDNLLFLSKCAEVIFIIAIVVSFLSLLRTVIYLSKDTIEL